MLVALRTAQHQRFQARIDDEGSNGIHQLHLQQFHGGDFRQHQSPGIASAQVDLLQVLIKLPFGEQVLAGLHLLRQQAQLR